MAILLISWTFRLQEPSKKLGIIVFMISAGVALASKGELRFDLVGFITQAAAVAVRFSILLHLSPLLMLTYDGHHSSKHLVSS